MHSEDETSNRPRKARVAIVGTGLAGLTTAYLLDHDEENRYQVTLFEQVRIAPDYPQLNSRSNNFSDINTGR